MNYNEFLNNVYTQFKTNNQYTLNKNVRFFKENNTNIVNFKTNDINMGIIYGTIVEQNNYVLIYFYIKNEVDDLAIVSKANIYMQHIAIITNTLINKGKLEKIVTIKRNFNDRKDLYKVSLHDEFINDNVLDSDLDGLITNIIEKYNQKSIQKRHKL